MVHEVKDMKFRNWLYADVPNRTRTDEFERSNDKQKKKQCTPTKEKAGKKANDPDMADTTSIPSKTGTREMQVDPPAHKRLATDSAGLVLPSVPATNLALTQWLGEDGDELSSPSNCSNSKKARIDSQEFSMIDRRPLLRRTAGHNEYPNVEEPGGTIIHFVRCWPSQKPIPRG